MYSLLLGGNEDESVALFAGSVPRHHGEPFGAHHQLRRARVVHHRESKKLEVHPCFCGD